MLLGRLSYFIHYNTHIYEAANPPYEQHLCRKYVGTVSTVVLLSKTATTTCPIEMIVGFVLPYPSDSPSPPPTPSKSQRRPQIRNENYLQLYLHKNRNRQHTYIHTYIPTQVPRTCATIAPSVTRATIHSPNRKKGDEMTRRCRRPRISHKPRTYVHPYLQYILRADDTTYIHIYIHTYVLVNHPTVCTYLERG